LQTLEILASNIPVNLCASFNPLNILIFLKLFLFICIIFFDKGLSFPNFPIIGVFTKLE
jgi:hypothetical protein